MRRSSAERSPARAGCSGPTHLEHSAQTTREQHHVPDCGIGTENFDRMDLGRERRKVSSKIGPGRPFIERSPYAILIIQNEYMFVILWVHHQTACAASRIRVQGYNRVA